MYRMEKITTGAAYGASAGSILNGMLNAYSPEQWNAIGVLVGIVIAVLTYLTNLYFKIREDNRRSRSREMNPTLRNKLIGAIAGGSGAIAIASVMLGNADGLEEGVITPIRMLSASGLFVMVTLAPIFAAAIVIPTGNATTC